MHGRQATDEELRGTDTSMNGRSDSNRLSTITSGKYGVPPTAFRGLLNSLLPRLRMCRFGGRRGREVGEDVLVEVDIVH